MSEAEKTETKDPVESKKKVDVSLMIASPVYSGASWGFVGSLFQTYSMLGELGRQLRITGLPGISEISMARNELTRLSRLSPSTHMLMIDSDITFAPSTVVRMIEKAEEGADVVCALPPVRQLDMKEIVEAAKKDHPRAEYMGRRFAMRMLGERDGKGRLEIGADGFGKVDTAGGAFMMVSMKALQKMEEAHPELRYRASDGTKGFALFQTMVRDEDPYAEDMAFCRRWRDLGGDIWALVNANFVHDGPYSIMGNIADTLGD